MNDFLSRARETAEREAEKAAPDRPIKIIGDYQENIFREIARDGFKAGFTSAVSRLPSEEEIAEAVMSVTNDPYYDGLKFSELREREARRFIEAARAVRELIERKMLDD